MKNSLITRMQKHLLTTAVLFSAIFVLHAQPAETAWDDSKLINITTFEQLDAIRYDLDGDGRPSSAGAVVWESAFGLSATVDDNDATHFGNSIVGYELRNDFPFRGTVWEDPVGGTCTTARTQGGWLPIGKLTHNVEDCFNAVFEGNSHVISGLYINRPRLNGGVGFFGYSGPSAQIRNLKLEGANVVGNADVGCLVGMNNHGSIYGCYAEGASTGNVNVGGLVGHNIGNYSRLHAKGTVNSSSAMVTATANRTYGTSGGLVGYNSGTIRFCYSMGIATGGEHSGALVGYNSNTIYGCYSTGQSIGGVHNGGLVGSNSGDIYACYAAGPSLSSTSGVAGGLVGDNSGTIRACYATVQTTTSAGAAGGLIGNNDGGTIIDSYFDYEISGREASEDYAQSTSALQSVTDYTGIYENWDITQTWEESGTEYHLWVLCTPSEYPVLYLDFDGDGVPQVSYSDGYQTSCSSSMPDVSDLPLGTIPDPSNTSRVSILEDSIKTQHKKISELGGISAAQEAEIVALKAEIEVLKAFVSNCDSSTDTLGIETTNADTLGIEAPNSGTLSIEPTNTDTLGIEAPNSGTLSIEPTNADTLGIEPTNTGTLSIEPTNADTLGIEPTNTGGTAWDNPKLINITTFEQLDAIRYDLDGDGRPSSAGAVVWESAFGLSATVDDNDATHFGNSIVGYELRNDFPFRGTVWEDPEGGTCTTARTQGGWLPIGTLTRSVGETIAIPFNAVFEGNSHVISGLYINRLHLNGGVGFFGYLGSSAQIRNLKLEGANVVGDADVGCLVGMNYHGSIYGCYAEGASTGDINVGGLVGHNIGNSSRLNVDGIVESSSAMVTATANKTYGTSGGLVGYNNGIIRFCYSMGIATGGEHSGALVGYNSNTIYGCYSTGQSTRGVHTGGLVGSNSGDIYACYAAGPFLSSTSGAAGGLVGDNSGTIRACYATVQTTTSAGAAGGLIGNNDGGTIVDSYFDSDVSNRPRLR